LRELLRRCRRFATRRRDPTALGEVADAVAKAANVPAADVRRAAMLLGDLGEAASLALTGKPLAIGLSPLIAVQRSTR